MIILYNDFNKPYFRNYPDCVEGIFCFDKLKCLAKRTCSGACYKFLFVKFLLAKIWKKGGCKFDKKFKESST